MIGSGRLFGGVGAGGSQIGREGLSRGGVRRDYLCPSIAWRVLRRTGDKILRIRKNVDNVLDRFLVFAKLNAYVTDVRWSNKRR